MSLMESRSLVWPSDYNWQRTSDIAPLTVYNNHHHHHHQSSIFNNKHKSKFNTSTLHPWMLSLFTVGLIQSKDDQDQDQDLPIKYEKEVLEEIIGWKQIDLQYPSQGAKNYALRKRLFVPENNLPLGIQRYRDRIFVSLPKWKDGVPVTLAVASMKDGASPILKPYPNWAWQTTDNCQGMISVFRMDIDECDRLWVLDAGVIDVENTVQQICPPQVLIFDLKSNQLVTRYSIPKDISPESSLLSNIVVEVLNEDCSDAYAYLGDVFRYGLVVYSLKSNTSWRVTHSYFYPDPLASDYVMDGIRFQWVDGLFGMALSPLDLKGYRYLYFHPLSSYREFVVPTHILRNTTLGFRQYDYFKIVGGPRGDSVSHSTGSAMDNYGVLFYNLLTKAGVGCWNSKIGIYHEKTQGLIYQNNETMSFPNDLRIDREVEQSVWVLSNRLHRFLYGKLDPKDVNFRILSGKTKDIVKGTICQQGAVLPRTIFKNDHCPPRNRN